MNKKEIVVYSKAVANKLVQQGFNLLRTEVNIKFPKYSVFIFEYDKELMRILKQL